MKNMTLLLLVLFFCAVSCKSSKVTTVDRGEDENDYFDTDIIADEDDEILPDEETTDDEIPDEMPDTYDDPFETCDDCEFTLKDVGFMGAAHRIEAKGKYMYVAYTSGVATYDISTDNYFQVGNIYLPGKIANMKIYGDHIFMVGEFGLRVYRLTDLLVTGGRPSPIAFYTGTDDDTGMLLHDISIKKYENIPVSGVLIAASELYKLKGSPRFFFFKWNKEEEILEKLSFYDGAAFLDANNPKPYNCDADRKYIQALALDDLNPKLYAGACNTGWIPIAKNNCCYIHEFDISDINAPVLNGDIQIDRGFIPSSMKTYKDKLWVGLSGAGSYAVFHSYDLYFDTLFSERTFINTCSRIPGGLLEGECGELHCSLVAGAQCNGTCINGECQCCFNGAFGYLDIIPEDELVVAVGGMSTDNPNKHNVFLFDVNASADQNYADATSESINFSFDVAGIPGKILIADEWTHAQGLYYSKDPLSITPHIEPGWMETKRAFSPGWHIVNMWENNGRIYAGHNLFMSADMEDLGNFEKWRTFGALEDRKWIFPKGVHRGEYIFAKGTHENFLVIEDGARMLLIHEDPVTRDFTLVNKEAPLHYSNSENFYVTPGRVLWPHDNVGFAPMGNRGMYAYYIDAPGGIIEERNKTSNILPLRESIPGLIPVSEGYTDIAFVEKDVIAVSVGLRGDYKTCGDDTDKMGGMHFFKVNYPEGVPDKENPHREILFEFIGEVNAFQCKNIPFLVVKDGWIMTVVKNYNVLIEDLLVYFRYSDVEAMNANSDHAQALKDISLPIDRFSPKTSGKTFGIPAFWGKERIAVPAARPQADTTNNNGVYIFDRNTKQQLYYYPATFNANVYFYQNDFILDADPLIHYLPPPESIIEGSNGDLYVGTHSGQIVRLGYSKK